MFGNKRCSVLLFFLVSFIINMNSYAGPYKHPNKKQRLELFNDLVSKIDEFHIFSERTQQNLNFKWSDGKEEYKRWFAEASNREELLWAIMKLQNSLHDKHCDGRRYYYQYSDTSPLFYLGFKVEVERHNGEFRYYVSDETKGVKKGDIVQKIDGMEVREYINRFWHLSPSNSFEHIYKDLAYYVTHRINNINEFRKKDFSTMVFQPRNGGKSYPVKFEWKKKEEKRRGGNDIIEYYSDKCHDLPEIDYGSYKLDFFGNNYCVYTSSAKERKEYPIVRFFSFNYDDTNFIRTDYIALKKWIDSKKLNGIIFDLRENHGGNNPNFFLDWFTDRPYVDNFVKMKIHDYLAEPNVLRQSMLWGPQIDWYMKEWRQKKNTSKRYTSMRPFFCNQGDCYWDNKYQPRNILTKKPMAMITGPGCVSSCDAVVYRLSEDKILPIIGERSSAAYTSHRLSIPVLNPADKKEISQFIYAVSTDHDGNTKKPIEGYAPPLYEEVYKNFENNDYYDELLVGKAIESLKRFKYRR